MPPGLRFNGLKYLGGNFDYEITRTDMTFTIRAGAALCLVDATGTKHVLVGGKPTTVPLAGVAFPAALGPCV